MASLISNSPWSFCIYGLGKTGISVVNYFNNNNFKEYCIWDDDKAKRALHSFTTNDKIVSSNCLDRANFIVMSPGISLKEASLKKKTYKKQRQNYYRS